MPGISLSSRLGIPLAQIVPGNEHEASDQPQVLEERVLGHETLGRRNLPETVGDERRDERECAQPKRADPAIEARKDKRRSGELGDDRCNGDGRGPRQAEMLCLGYRAAEIEQLDKATLQVGGTKSQQSNEAN